MALDYVHLSTDTDLILLTTPS